MRVVSSLHSVAVVAFCLMFACSRPATAQEWPQPVLAEPISGVNFPVHINHAGDGSGRIFVVEVGGRIRVVKNGVLLNTPFLDISSVVSQGLFSIAFAPDYATSGQFYVNYVDQAFNVVVARYHVTGDPDIADSYSGQIILRLSSPHAGAPYFTAGHAGGELAFSPRDGYLYVGIGDGDEGNRDTETVQEGDSLNLAQNPTSLHGKMLRLDVSGSDGFPDDPNRNYTIPATNPFRSTAGYLPEIWALGVRNPWRSSFDRLTGDYYIGDVGQDAWEEVDYQAGSSAGGENYGWKTMEGNHCYSPKTGCDQTGLTLPAAEYPHDANQLGSVTGGRVYRGSTYQRMQGIYFYGDYNFGDIWGLRRQNGVWQNTLLIDNAIPAYGLISFGEDEAGNIWVTNANAGTIYKITDSVLNVPPVANDQNVATNEDTARSITLTASDADGDTLTYSVVAGPGHGTLSGTGATRNYTPASNYNGPDSFTFKVSDGPHDSNIATVSITVNAVNDAPVASNDTATGQKNKAINISVLANDTDIDGGALSITSVTQPARGSTAINAGGLSVKYTPAKGFTGTTTFSYRASDGRGGSGTALVTVTVK